MKATYRVVCPEDVEFTISVTMFAREAKLLMESLRGDQYIVTEFKSLLRSMIYDSEKVFFAESER